MPPTLALIAATSSEVGSTRSRLKKVASLAGCLHALKPDELPTGVSYLSGVLPQGRIGVGPAALKQAAGVTPAGESRLSLAEVDARLTDIAAIGGQGSTQRRAEALGALFARATAPEQRFLAQLLLGELRQGALEGVLADALAEAFVLPPERVRRAYMLVGDLARVATTARREGLAGIDAFRLQLLQPLRPMLAQTAEDVATALGDAGERVLEYKLDGIRIQAHKDGDQVRLFTRQLNDVSAQIPELVASIAALPARRLVLDGEALVLDAKGRALPFQQTMARLGSKLDVARLSAELPARGFFFDLLLVDGEEVFDRPLLERQRALDDLLPEPDIMPRLITSDPVAGETFLQQALDAGHEGIMSKAPSAPYEAGNRGSAWRKIKHSYSLDLVILAAEWGSGRRKAWLSNLHLGARDPATGGFVMLGKTFKGLTDAQLAWQTQRLQEIAVAREGNLVYVKPEVVVEIAFNEVQTSPQYPAGMALRFARVKRFRPDKSAQEADTIEAVREIYRSRFAAPEETSA
ncbi:ATP-dependent DNA ligase [Thiorhodococcus minor]|uniref:Probable DNA ligase n=1 Tax=Thiorhodococcus minor TaxID=57489 RepID=A0A6M0JUP3_9GAMM|nr:ATP-dependent DNA ligase [Thiorhodococcus minor]NEV61236.1 ATP-dependent DNA ligase [Thiorhodococcus minor]